jgi:hypothetical protein
MQFDTRTQQDNYQQVNQWMQQIVAQAEGHVTLKTDSNRPRFVLTYDLWIDAGRGSRPSMYVGHGNRPARR